MRDGGKEAPVGGPSVPTHNLSRIVSVPEADAFFEVEDDNYEDAMGDIEELMTMEDEEL